MRRPDVVVAAAGFVQVVIEVGAGRDEAVDVALGDEMGDDHPQPAGAECAGHAEEDRAVAAEHLLPDAPRGGEIAPLKRNAFHPRRALRQRADPAAIMNGSTGARRKRDFVFMPPILCHEPEDPKGPIDTPRRIASAMLGVGRCSSHAGKESRPRQKARPTRPKTAADEWPSIGSWVQARPPAKVSGR